jgi:ankyrin repeat protein
LHSAGQFGAPDNIVKALIDASADPQAKDKDGKTPADLAHYNDHVSTDEFIEQYVTVPTKSANFIV